MFLKLDTSNDGFLTEDELRSGMNEVIGTLKASLTNYGDLIGQLDANNDGMIDYGEFISAAVNRSKVVTDENIAMAFQLFDADGNGEISIDELKQAF